ncbi:DUF3769 domain-containing protein [Leptolyngbya sp. BC1307]|uniref:DUF3769 domain-containing protein n=1 Tax=Leptolyngbya sp. BC1307 TaxID=2029589 RepID=UPI000EFAAA4D|nr:DUF3769 domain-containing protein [Leptolyngbya sp. BC1307]
MVYFDLPPQPPAVEVVEPVPVASIHPLLAPLLRNSAADQRLSQAETELPTLPPAAPPGDRPTEPASEPGSAPPIAEPEPIEGPVRIEIEAEDELTPEELANQLQLTADYQEYDPIAQTITARGNVVLRLNDAIIESDQLWVNLVNRYALAEGDVLLTRGSQIIRGSRAEYSFIQQSGAVSDAAGTLYLPDVGTDLASPLEGRSPATRRAYDPINRNPGLQVGSDGSVQISTTPGARPTGANEGAIQQLRFETDQLAFDVEGYRAEGVRITNDPFSPPELELRADSLLLRNISATQDELLLKRPRLVFDQGFSLPLLRSRLLLSRGTVNPEDLSPVPAQAGIDGSDRGGFFLGRKIPLVRNERVRLSVTPQFFIAQALSSESSSPIDPDNFGVSADLSAQLSPRTTLRGSADLTSLDFLNITEKLRTNIRAEQLIGDHRLALQYSYRERLFNGSLGFQDVQYSLGTVLLSPEVILGDNGPRLTYQASAQLINAESDRTDLLLASGSDTGRVTLGRYQASAALSQGFNLWRGEPKPATQTEGLRFTPQPLVPYLNLNTGLRTTGTYYSSGDFQDSLIAEVGIEGQLGHFARNFGDYTRFNVSYAQSFIGGADSPFLFDREIDRRILSLGLTQQIYGPFLAGFQTALSLNRGRTIDTIYTLEYSRRTYGILLRYDTTQNTGAIGFRLSNFSWVGDTDPFDSPRIRQVESGVIESP